MWGVKILGGFLHVWNFRISVPLLQTWYAKVSWNDVGQSRARRSGAGPRFRPMSKGGRGGWRWEKGELGNGHQRHANAILEVGESSHTFWRSLYSSTASFGWEGKMGLQRAQIWATLIWPGQQMWVFWMSIDAHFIYSVARTTTQVFAGFFRHRCTFREGTWWHEWILPLKGREGLWLQRQYY